jgi:hypothetical protein
MTQKEKNEKLMTQIESFESKNKMMRTKINNALLLKMGHKTIDEVQPFHRDGLEHQDMKLKLRSLVTNQKEDYITNDFLMQTPIRGGFYGTNEVDKISEY